MGERLEAELNSRSVQFAPDASGRASTTASGKRIFQAALAGVDDQLGSEIGRVSNWRKEYPPYIARLTAVSHKSPDNAQQVAQQGLAAAYEEFCLGDKPLSKAMREPAGSQATQLHTAHIVGDRWGEAPQLLVPYGDQLLDIDTLKPQLALWEARGIIEPGHADSVRSVLETPALARKSGRWFVLLGAGAELGPYETLLNLGATIVAVDVPKPAIWQRLIEAARASTGELIFPTREATDDKTDAELAHIAGADLLSETAEIGAWLLGLERPLCLGCYAYLDGGDFVRVTMAMDAIADLLLSERPETALACLLTPTDAYVVPQEVLHGWQVAYQQRLLLRGFGRLLGGRFFAPNIVQAQESEFGLVDSIVPQQGPNYMLAKRLQQWRAIDARANGHLVSCNVAPASFTSSVLSNKLFATGYRGAQSFGLEIFQPPTANGLMGAQLVADMTHDTEAAQLPLNELFMLNANHGGMWRTPFQVRSVLVAGVLIGLFSGGYG